MSKSISTVSARASWRLSVVVLFALLILPWQGIQALEYGGIGGRPAYPREDNPRTESIFIHTLAASAVQDEGILLVNNSADKKTLLVYGVDSVVSSGGAFACRQISEPKEGVGAWLNLEKDEVVLNAGASELVPFTIKVPENVSVGEHNGCIVIQEKKDEVEGQAGVNLSFRTGLRVAISVPGEIVRNLEISSFTLSRAKQGGVVLTPEVKNLGNVSIDANVKVITKNLFGVTYLEQGGNFPILRDESANWNFEVTKPFWGGFYRSSLVVEYQSNVETEIGKDASGPITVLKGKTVTFFSMPQTVALIIEILILLGILVLLFLYSVSRKRQAWIKKSWQEEEVGSGADIKALADSRQISWKLLAKANGLKAPYIIDAGKKLKLPPKR